MPSKGLDSSTKNQRALIGSTVVNFDESGVRVEAPSQWAFNS